MFCHNLRTFMSWVSFLRWDGILKNAVIKPLIVAIDFHSIYFHAVEVNGDQQQFGTLKYILFLST